jgi:hypothetical protein
VIRNHQLSPATRCSAIAFAAAAVLALGFAHDLLHMPLQVADCLSLILDASMAPSAWDAFSSRLHGDGYFRPLFYAEVKMLFDLASGNYALAYRLFHASLLIAFLLLFVRALSVRDRVSLAVVPLALTVFVGIHTFLTAVKEAYPVNHFLQVGVLALVALNFTQSRRGTFTDVALLMTFAAAALTLESGLLIWVIVVAAWAAGMPGASRRTAALITAALGAYAVVRFGVYGTGLPTVEERSSGFLLSQLDPAAIEARFGGNLAPFYAYNILSSVLSVLFSEPRSGIWVTFRAFMEASVYPRNIINIVASCLATGLLAAYVVDRVRAGVRSPSTLADRHVVIFAAVLAANAAFAYAYPKDEIMTTAGAFYALAVFGAAVHFVERLSARPMPRRMAVAACVLFLIGSTSWAIRAAGVHQVLRSQAFSQRNDWTRMEREWRKNGAWERYAASRPLLLQLRQQAVETPVVNPAFIPRWMDRVVDAHY